MSYNDPVYECWLCSAKLHYSGILKCVVDSQGREHVCNHPTSVPQPKQVYLSQQNHENRLQRDYDEYFAQKKTTDIRKEAKELEKYNRSMTYDKKQ